MEDFQPYIEAAASLAPVTVPFLGVVLAVFLALRRFQKEQIWLKRLDAYTKILDALHICKRDYDYGFHHEISFNEGSPAPSEQTPEFRLKVREADELLRRTAATGRLIISDRAIAALDEYHRQAVFDEGCFLHEYFDSMSKSCEIAIGEITAAGRNELNLRRWSLDDLKSVADRLDRALEWLDSAPARHRRGQGQTSGEI